MICEIIKIQNCDKKIYLNFKIIKSNGRTDGIYNGERNGGTFAIETI